MAYGRQTGPGIPGGFPLPNAGAPGNTYKINSIHPAAAVGQQRISKANTGPGGQPGVMGGKR